KRVVVVVQDDHEPGAPEARVLAAVEPLPRRRQRLAHESIVRPLTTHRSLGLAVSEEPTKQSRAASARSSVSAAGSGSGAISTASSTSVSTSAYRPSVSRLVTSVRPPPKAERTSTPLGLAW